ncbi:hypothetical protein ABIA33_001226 [Streptacidiphilus sp. MAP12-16]|uniref:hypothetical protein n=1 Tax=Streptacidiphilus sp. MAP12-16 TaxID=3156300 RepID=UPI0035146215
MAIALIHPFRCRDNIDPLAGYPYLQSAGRVVVGYSAGILSAEKVRQQCHDLQHRLMDGLVVAVAAQKLGLLCADVRKSSFLVYILRSQCNQLSWPLGYASGTGGLFALLPSMDKLFPRSPPPSRPSPLIFRRMGGCIRRRARLFRARGARGLGELFGLVGKRRRSWSDS